MVKGERIMPVPGGEITSTESWQAPVEVESAEAIAAIEDDEELVEAVEELVQDDLPELS
jgi:hypothetical protein